MRAVTTFRIVLSFTLLVLALFTGAAWRSFADAGNSNRHVAPAHSAASTIASPQRLAPVGAHSAPVVTGSISVSGNAQVMVVPNEVVFTLGVETNNKQLMVAKQQNDDIIKRVLALTREYGIDSKYVQTDYINIEPEYKSSYESKDDLIGFFVRKTVVIHLNKLSLFEGFYTDVLAAGVNHVQGIQFRTTQLRRYRDQARALAIKAAREKAVALSGGAGQTIGHVKTIHEDQNDWGSSYYSWWGYQGNVPSQNVVQNAGPSSSSLSGDETLAPGQISVNAGVTVEFELIK